MADSDFIDRLQTSRDTLRKFQSSLARMAMPAEQRKALVDGMTRFVMPGDQIQAMVDLVDAFGPPLAQIETFRSELADHRVEVERMEARLAHLESAAERLALAAENMIAMQDPFIKMAELLTGQKAERKGAINPDDKTEATDTPEPEGHNS